MKNKGDQDTLQKGIPALVAQNITIARRGIHPDTAREHRESTQFRDAPFSRAFTYRGGPVIENPQVYAVILGKDTRSPRMTGFMTDLFNSNYFHLLRQYGCGSPGQFNPSPLFIPGLSAISNWDDSTIQTILNDHLTDLIPEPSNPNTIYLVFLDDTMTGNGIGFGYHSFFTTALNNFFYYAVIPDLTDAWLENSCAIDSICSLHLGQTQEQRQTLVISHLLSEIMTNPQTSDPYPVAYSAPNAWIDSDGNEIADLCNGLPATITVGANTWTVQKLYSLWEDIRTRGATIFTAAPPEIEVVPLARYYNGPATDHFYTTDLNELGYDNKGYDLEKIQCYILPPPLPDSIYPPGSGLVPLFRYWNGEIADHFYTTDFDELGTGAGGWVYEFIQGYVYRDQVTGTIPLYRYWNLQLGDHLYTTGIYNGLAYDPVADTPAGYAYEGIQCYVYAADR